MRRAEPPAPREVGERYDAVAAEFDQAMLDESVRLRWAIIETPLFAAAHGAAKVLDLGCGTGRLMRQVTARQRVGIDVSMGMLRQARQRGLPVARADAHQLPFASGTFDAIVAGNIAFRYLRWDDAFAECARVLRPGGRLAIHEYAARTWTLKGLLNGSEPSPLHLRTVDELVPFARGAGLHLVGLHLYRPIRFHPFVVRIPLWLPGRWWRHSISVFRKP